MTIRRRQKPAWPVKSTLADDVRDIGYALSAPLMDDNVGKKVKVPAAALSDMDDHLQAVADEIDRWSMELHEHFRKSVRALQTVADHLGYDLTCTQELSK